MDGVKEDAVRYFDMHSLRAGEWYELTNAQRDLWRCTFNEHKIQNDKCVRKFAAKLVLKHAWEPSFALRKAREIYPLFSDDN